MNKDFFRPLLIAAFAIILAIALALIIPAWENDFFPIRKMPWLADIKNQEAVADSLPPAERIEHASTALHPFLKKLAQMPVLEGKEPFVKPAFIQYPKKLRIAYYSDSTIEGDLITAPLRYELQSTYGGSGVGMMPITSIVAGFRQSIRHSFSKNWESISFMTPATKGQSLGITGHTFIPRSYYLQESKIEPEALPDSLISEELPASLAQEIKPKSTRVYVDYNPWVEYKAMDIAGGAPYFDNIRLFYSGAGENSRVYVSYDAKPPQSFWLDGGAGLKVLDLSPENPVKSIRLEFAKDDPIRVYGLSFDQNTGVYVDNYPIRGYSGMYFSRISEDILSAFQRHLDYDLIILQYGENVSHHQTRDYGYYEKAMRLTVEHIQAACPNTPVLIVSAHDRSIKDASGYHTSPDIPILVQSQAAYAGATGSAFFNLYEAMGGYNSMIGYVKSSPPLASSDYTHFTRRGAEHVARLLLEYLAGKN